MKHSKKIITALVCIVALLAVTVAGTIAYLTDEDTVVNTFTVGKVDITLNESPVDEDGKAITGDNVERVKANEYHLIPGMEYDKDPTITVKAGSENAYVRMMMTVYNASAVQAIIDNEAHGLEDYADLFSGWDETTWLYQGFIQDTDADTITFEFRYKEVINGYNEETDAAEDMNLEPLFTKLIAPGTLTSDELASLYGDETDTEDDFMIEIVGHAVQADSFADSTDAETGETITAEDAAWAAFDGQMKEGSVNE